MLLSGCAAKLDSGMAEEVTAGHAKCKEAKLKTEIEITPIMFENPIITIKCNPQQ